MHAYMTPGMLSYAVCALADGTEIEVALLQKRKWPEPLPEGWTYLGEVVRYVSGKAVHKHDLLKKR